MNYTDSPDFMKYSAIIRSPWSLGALAFYTSLTLCSLASAQDADEEIAAELEKPLWELGVGAGALLQPQYPSSSEHQTRGLALPYVVYRGEVLRIGDGQSARAVAAENSRYELSMSFAAAFDADSEGNELRRGMDDLDFIFEAGPQLVFKLGNYTYSDTSRSELQLATTACSARNWKPLFLCGLSGRRANCTNISTMWLLLTPPLSDPPTRLSPATLVPD